MSTLSRPALRWAVPVGITALVLGGAVLGPALSASAEVEVPERTPAQLLVDLRTADVEAYSGTVVTRAELGLPELPEGLGGDDHGYGTDPLSLLTGEHELRVWASGDKARVAIHGRMGESDVVADGSGVWLWSSDDGTATHLVLPDGASHTDAPHTDGEDALAEAMPPMTPQGLSAAVLERLEPTTAVTSAPPALVAGRPAHVLVLEPRSEASLVGSVRIAVDAAELVPTRVQVFARGAQGPALEVGFTSLSFEAPDDAVFAFTPPAGATVEERVLEGHHHDEPEEGSPLPGDGTATGPRPGAVLGHGWDAVVVTRTPEALGAVDGELGTFLGTLPRISGAWGSGTLLTSTLATALLTDDGRLLVGAVGPDALIAAASDPAADLG